MMKEEDEEERQREEEKMSFACWLLAKKPKLQKTKQAVIFLRRMKVWADIQKVIYKNFMNTFLGLIIIVSKVVWSQVILFDKDFWWTDPFKALRALLDWLLAVGVQFFGVIHQIWEISKNITS